MSLDSVATAHPYLVRNRGPWRSLVVLSLWLAGAATVLVCIVLYGRDIPLAEDWHMVPPLTGREPNLLAWAWEQNNEHRLPVQKLLYLGLLKLSGGDFRTGMVANLAIVSGICLAMLLVACRLRGGRTALADAAFPLLLLHLGHWENLVWGWQIQFVVTFALASSLLLVIVAERWPLRRGVALAAGAVLVLLPLTGANGLLMAVFLAPWFAMGAWIYRQEMVARWIPEYLIACACLALALSGLYLAGYRSPEWAPPNPGLLPTLITAGKFMAMALGPMGAHPRASIVLIPAVLAGLVATGVLVLLALRRHQGPERFRAFGLLLFAAGSAALILAMGWGRAGWVPSFGMPYRYALMSVPTLCWAFFVWLLYGPSRLREWALALFALGALLVLPLNVRAGLAWRDWYVAGMSSVERDLCRGMDLAELADRHVRVLMHWNRGTLEERMRMLEEAGLGPWAARGRCGAGGPLPAGPAAPS